MEMNTVTVYDIQNKFIAYSAPYPEVIDVMCESGSIFIFTGDRKVSDCQNFKGAKINQKSLTFVKHTNRNPSIDLPSLQLSVVYPLFKLYNQLFSISTWFLKRLSFVFSHLAFSTARERHTE